MKIFKKGGFFLNSCPLKELHLDTQHSLQEKKIKYCTIHWSISDNFPEGFLMLRISHKKHIGGSFLYFLQEVSSRRRVKGDGFL